MDLSKIKNEVTPSTVKDSSQVSKSKNLRESKPTQSILGTEVGGLGGSSMEKVTWSDDASIFTDGMRSVKAADETRSEKVAELKAAIKNGTYKVDPQAIAEKMLKAEAEELLAAKKS